MKKLIVCVAIALTSCGPSREELLKRNEVSDYHLAIAEVSGHSYIYNVYGGVIHAESCKCKSLKP